MSREGAVFMSTVGAESPMGQAEAVAGDECERAWEASWGGVGVGDMGAWLGCSDLAGEGLLRPPEPEVTIVRGLVDTEVQADGEAEFSCEVSQAGVDAEWRLQGLPLQSNEVTDVAVQGGRTHTLRLKSVTPEDAGTVSFHVGRHTSSAQLTVRGSRSRASLHLRAGTPCLVKTLSRDRERWQAFLPLRVGSWR